MKSWAKYLLTGCMIVQMSLLVGCGTNKHDNVAMGRYIEQDMNSDNLFDADQTFIAQKSSGQLEILAIDKEGLKIYEEEKDGCFKEINLPGLEEVHKILKEKEATITTIDLDANDQLYIVAVGIKEGGDPYNVGDFRTYIMTTNGKEDSTIQITQLQEKDKITYIMPTQLEVLTSGACIVGGNMAGLSQYDLETGNLTKTYSEEEDGRFIVKDDVIYVANALNQEIDLYNMSTGQVDKSVPTEEMDAYTQLLQGDQGIYMVNGKGIWHLADGGEVWEELMTSTGVSLGLPSYHVESVFYREGKFITRLSNSEGGYKFKSYTYSKATPSKPEIELTAYILEDNQAIREALVHYELTHPTVRINVKQGVNEMSGITREDAVKALNTELLAGGGPDILLLDGLDLKTYTEKHVLANLEDIEGIDAVLPQIREAFKEGDGTYVMPLRFTAPCLLGSDEVLREVNSIETLMAYQKSHMDTPIMTHMTPLVLFNSMASLESAHWLSEDGKLDQEKVQNFLEGIYNLSNVYDKEHVALEGDSDLGEVISIATGETKMQIWDISNIWDLLYASSAIDQRGEGNINLLKQNGKACFKPVAMVGINQNSKDLKLAKEIVGSMFVEENQKADLGEGFPTMQIALENWLAGKEINQGTTKSISMHSEDGQSKLRVKASWDSKQLLPHFEEEMTQLEVPILGNATLEAMVLEEATPYFNGEKTLKEVMTALEPKVALYSEG